jgi:hypothetical protein
LDVLGPKLFDRFAFQIRAQQVGAFAGLAPGAALLDQMPIQNPAALA